MNFRQIESLAEHWPEANYPKVVWSVDVSGRTSKYHLVEEVEELGPELQIL
jgi:hypothetical protein